jgi:hypothetical protein
MTVVVEIYHDQEVVGGDKVLDWGGSGAVYGSAAHGPVQLAQSQIKRPSYRVGLSPIAIFVTVTALPIESAGRFWHRRLTFRRCFHHAGAGTNWAFCTPNLARYQASIRELCHDL